MANQDDDFLERAVPDPDAEPTAAERAHARTFASIIDKALVGRPPAAMSSDDRALLEVATVIRAAKGAAELAPERQTSIVESALRQAIGGAGGASGVHGAVTSISAARTQRRRWVPWTVAGASAMAAAAVLVLWLRTPAQVVEVPVATRAVPTSWTSRPADALIGPIDRGQSGAASARIDAIFADRLDGYRERRLAGRGGK